MRPGFIGVTPSVVAPNVVAPSDVIMVSSYETNGVGTNTSVRRYVVSSTQVETDVVVECIVDTASLIASSRMSVLGSAEFLLDDGTACPYWIENGLNTSSTRYWFRIPTLPVGDTQVRMLFSATEYPPQNPQSVFLFFDDFQTYASSASGISTDLWQTLSGFSNFQVNGFGASPDPTLLTYIKTGRQPVTLVNYPPVPYGVLRGVWSGAGPSRPKVITSKQSAVDFTTYNKPVVIRTSSVETESAQTLGFVSLGISSWSGSGPIVDVSIVSTGTASKLGVNGSYTDFSFSSLGTGTVRDAITVTGTQASVRREKAGQVYDSGFFPYSGINKSFYIGTPANNISSTVSTGESAATYYDGNSADCYICDWEYFSAYNYYAPQPVYVVQKFTITASSPSSASLNGAVVVTSSNTSFTVSPSVITLSNAVPSAVITVTYTSSTDNNTSPGSTQITLSGLGAVSSFTVNA